MTPIVTWNKKIVFIIAIVFLLGISFLFKGTIRGLFVTQSDDKNPVATQSPRVSESPSPSSSVLPSPAPTPRPVTPKPPPSYHGRDPAEVRPVPDEVKLFSEAQKQEIYNAIGNHAKAVKENPDYFNGWINVGVLKKVIGDYTGAADAWEYAGVIRPLNSLSFANLGELYWRYIHDFPKAETNLNISIKNKPDDVQTYVTLSDLYFYSLKEKADLAVGVLLQGISANPESVDLPRALASLYERQGNYPSAIEWWQKVLARRPDDTAVSQRIEELKKKTAQ